MVRNKWTYIGSTKLATIYVNYNQRKTKIRTENEEYYHEGIYPFHNKKSHRIKNKKGTKYD